MSDLGTILQYEMTKAYNIKGIKWFLTILREKDQYSFDSFVSFYIVGIVW